MAEKRKDTSVAGALIKRAKQDDESNNSSLITLSSERSGTKNAIVGTVRVMLFFIPKKRQLFNFIMFRLSVHLV